MLEEIKQKVVKINVEELIKRLKLELNTEENEKSKSLLEYALYDTLLLILDITHLNKIDNKLYYIWVSMIKDYWYLNNYNNLRREITAENETEDISVGEVKSIVKGDERTEFYEQSNSIIINGVKYETGTIEFDKNILREKYKKDLYRHRKKRWTT